MKSRDLHVPCPLLCRFRLDILDIIFYNCKGHGKKPSPEHERRKQQMQGKYHSPLVGYKHQVSSLPPFPASSRPLVLLPPKSAAAAAKTLEKLLSSSDTVLSPKNGKGEGAVSVKLEAKPLVMLQANRDNGASLNVPTVPCAALDGEGYFSCMKVVTEKKSSNSLHDVVERKPPPILVRLLPPPQITCEARPEAITALESQGSRKTINGIASSPAHTKDRTVQTVSQSIFNSLAVIEPIVSIADGKGAKLKDWILARSGEDSEVVALEKCSDVDAPILVSRPSPAVAQTSGEGGNASSNAENGMLLPRTTCSCPMSVEMPFVAPTPLDKPVVQSPLGSERIEKRPSENGLLILLPAPQLKMEKAKERSPSPSPLAAGREHDNLTLVLATSIPSRSQSPSLQDPPPTQPTASWGSSSTSRQISASAGSEAEKTISGAAGAALAIQLLAVQSHPPSATATRAFVFPNPVCRKRTLPSVMMQSLGGGGGRSQGRNDGSSCVESCNDCIPPPDLSFDEVAELVWDPRAGPKPRGMVEREYPGGKEAYRIALERAMWERDSTLLERVAPAHAEKAMQVLQVHRHDVERAAQMLSVRHGIHVVGLSSVRATRNSRAGQQASSNPSRSSSPLAAGLPWHGVPVKVSCGDGSGGGSRPTGNVLVKGWEPAAASSSLAPPKPVSKKADAQGLTREEATLAEKAFFRYGRDIDAVAKELGWKRNRTVEFYYCVWKYTPRYQVITRVSCRYNVGLKEAHRVYIIL